MSYIYRRLARLEEKDDKPQVPNKPENNQLNLFSDISSSAGDKRNIASLDPGSSNAGEPVKSQSPGAKKETNHSASLLLQEIGQVRVSLKEARETLATAKQNLQIANTRNVDLEVELDSLQINQEDIIRKAEDSRKQYLLLKEQINTAPPLEESSGGINKADTAEQVLARVDEPGFIRALPWLVCGSVVILGVIFGGVFIARYQEQKELVSALEQTLAGKREFATVRKARVEKSKVVPHTRQSWPVIQVPGIQIKQTESDLIMTFKYGVFIRGVKMAAKARIDLLALAKQSKDFWAGLELEIEGHTDTAPVSSTGMFTSNYELGYKRARAVRDFLIMEAGWPVTAVVVTSAGEKNPPYPNNSLESRRKNRTVVLKLRQVDGT